MEPKESIELHNLSQKLVQPPNNAFDSSDFPSPDSHP